MSTIGRREVSRILLKTPPIACTDGIFLNSHIEWFHFNPNFTLLIHDFVEID